MRRKYSKPKKKKRKTQALVINYRGQTHSVARKI
jgi:hypothetical protein